MFASRALRGCRTLLAGSSLTPPTANLAQELSTMSLSARSGVLSPHHSLSSLVRNLLALKLKGSHMVRFYHQETASGKEVMSRMKLNRNIRDYKRRLLLEKYELRRNLYKAFWQDQNLPNEIREKFRYKMSKLPRSSSHTRVRTR